MVLAYVRQMLKANGLSRQALPVVFRSNNIAYSESGQLGQHGEATQVRTIDRVRFDRFMSKLQLGFVFYGR